MSTALVCLHTYIRTYVRTTKAHNVCMLLLVRLLICILLRVTATVALILRLRTSNKVMAMAVGGMSPDPLEWRALLTL